MFKAMALLMLVTVCVVACGPQPLPFVPTPIPSLIPATLPVPSAVAEGGQAEGGVPTPPPAGGGTAAGAQVFEKQCSLCHNLTAEIKIGPGLAGVFGRDKLPNGNPVTDDNVKAWIRSGGGGASGGIAMPGIPLTGADLDAVVAFLKDATK